jgi:hypothetical protein
MRRAKMDSEAVVACIKALLQPLPRELKESCNKLSHN